MAIANQRALGGHSLALPPAHDLHEPLQPLAPGRRLETILETVSKAYDGDIQLIDSSSIRVHQHAANVKKRGTIPLHGSFARRPDATYSLVDVESEHSLLENVGVSAIVLQIISEVDQGNSLLLRLSRLRS